MRRAPRLHGRLLGEDHGALLEASATARGLRGDVLHVSVDSAVPDVPFALACPPTPTFDLHVTRAQDALDVQRFAGLAPESVWEERLRRPCAVTLAPCDDAPGHPPASEVRAIEPGGARGARLAAAGERGSGFAVVLGAGAWSLEVGTASAPWSAAHSLEASDDGEVALGLVPLGPSAVLRLPRRGLGGPGLGAELWREDVAYEALVLPRSFAASEDVWVRLPPGDYRVVHEDGATAPLRLGAGAEVALPWRSGAAGQSGPSVAPLGPREHAGAR